MGNGERDESMARERQSERVRASGDTEAPLAGRALTPRRRQFVNHYLAAGRPTYLNATQAAVAAGFGPKTARQAGHRLLTNVDISAAVDARLARCGITTDRLLRELAAHAFEGDAADFEPFVDGSATLGELRSRGVNTRLVKKARVAVRQGTVSRAVELVDAHTAIRELLRVLLPKCGRELG
ncbi:MAG: terminase small subunit [Phycisphaerae bacterium]|nr:terminase small subunit [Phycisphaerae bacterium]